MHCHLLCIRSVTCTFESTVGPLKNFQFGCFGSMPMKVRAKTCSLSMKECHIQKRNGLTTDMFRERHGSGVIKLVAFIRQYTYAYVQYTCVCTIHMCIAR